MHTLIPSAELPSGREALRRVLVDANRLDVAVAFLTGSGIQVLRELFAEFGTPSRVRFVVRGAPITDPDAVIALADLGAEVRVVMGVRAPRFHPKLWITTNAESVHVLSGSGNLTAGGLDHNDEQFEMLHMRLPDEQREAAAHHERWDAFFALGSPLADAISSPSWAEWIAQQSRRLRLTEELARLDRQLAGCKAPAPGGNRRGGRGGVAGERDDLSWLEQVLQEAVGDSYTTQISTRAWGERVQVHAGEGRGFKYLFLTFG